MSEYTYKQAKVRWTQKKDDSHLFIFDDGTEYRFPSFTPEHVLDRLNALPRDYIDLGNEAADLKWDAEQAERKREAIKLEYDALVERLESAAGQDTDKLLVILQQDLEVAINLILRFASALGIQAGGELYTEVQALANKYKMSYKAPDSAHDLVRNLDPLPMTSTVRWSDDSFDYTMNTWKTNDEEEPNGEVLNVKFNEETGKLDIAPVDPPSDGE